VRLALKAKATLKPKRTLKPKVKTPAKAKVKTKVKPRVNTRVKAKRKTRVKAKFKTRVEAKRKTRVEARANKTTLTPLSPKLKPKSKAKSKTKSKTKPKTNLKRVFSDAIIAKRFHSQLLSWFDVNGRHDLPWQRERTFYRVWVSEIMLQQTQVSTVIGYFARFMHAFPSVTHLARAPLDEVLALWSGLGYYARARHLHQAAMRIVNELQGEFPRTRAGWQQLPGVGASTAGAIVAQVLNLREPILDGNVKRVIARAFALALTGQAFIEACWAYVERITPTQRPADFTQAIMDLGATVCTRSRPACERCPIQPVCRAHADKQTSMYPLKTAKPLKKTYAKTWCYLHTKEQVYLRQRPSHGVWGGLWELVEFASAAELKAWVNKHLKQHAANLSALAPIEHVFTHMVWRISCYRLKLTTPLALPHLAGEWVSRKELTKRGLPAPVLKLLNLDYT
jgi:A/G-specific adenine glycosylase